MAYEGNLDCIPGIVASGDLSAHQFKFMTITATGAALNTTAGGICDGVLQNKPDALGKAASVASRGVTKVVAGAAVAAGSLVASNASGLAVVATTGQEVCGRALEAAGASGDLIAISQDTSGQAP